MSIDPETLARIRRIDLRTRRLVNESFAGAYHSVFKGRGMAFDAVRPYQPGDDVRDIDWNVTARADEAFVKQYTEERELTLMIVLDGSASLEFGTVNRQKRELAAELGAVMAYAAIANNDRVGLLVFTDGPEHFIAPRKGRNHVLHVIRDVLAANPQGKQTDIGAGLKAVNRLLKQRAIVFFLSDFLALSKSYMSDLLVTSRRHDMIAAVLSDPLEDVLPGVGLIRLSDAETGETALVDTSDMAWRQRVQQRVLQFAEIRDSNLRKAGADRIDISTSGDYVLALTEFFRRRARRIAR